MVVAGFIYKNVAAALAPLFLCLAIIFGVSTYYFVNDNAELRTQNSSLESQNEILAKRDNKLNSTCEEKRKYSKKLNDNLEKDLDVVRDISSRRSEVNHNVMQMEVPDEILKTLDPSFTSDNTSVRSEASSE